MTKQELHERLAAKTGEDLKTIERIGFELNTFEPDRKEFKRQRRLKFWRQQRRDRNLANIAAKVNQS